MIFSLDDTGSKHDEEEEEEEEVDLEMGSSVDNASSVCSARSTTLTAHRRTSTTVTVLILLLGCIASAAFLTIGVLYALRDSQRTFETDVEQLAVRVHNSFREYETAALYVHQFSYSHKKNTATVTSNSTIPFASNFRSLFRSLYDSIVAKGLPLHAIEYIPNVTRDDRAAYEADAEQFYEEHYPEAAKKYSGFSGFVLDDSVPQGVSLKARPPDDFYFPVHFVEPVSDNVGVIDFDVYSEDYPRWAVNTALDTRQPVITGRLRLIQEPDPSPDAFSVLMMHPGIATEHTYDEDENTPSGDVSLIAIRIPSLLDYVTTQEHLYETLRDPMPTVNVYLYDSTPDDPTLEEPLFLGGATVTHGDPVELEYLPETPLTDLKGHMLYQVQLEIGLRQWTLACVAAEGTYPPNATFAIVGGVMIFVAFLCLSLWVWTTMSRTAQTSRLKAKMQEEQAHLRIDHARQAAAAERQLNEFIAHEVRNPLAAAMSACSFVTTAIQESGNGLFTTPPPPQSTAHAIREKDAPKPLFALITARSSATTESAAAPQSTAPQNSTTPVALSTAPPISEKDVPKPLLALPTTTTESSAAAQSTPTANTENDAPKPLFALPIAATPEPLHQSNAQSKAPTASAPLFAISTTPSTATQEQSEPPTPLFSLPLSVAAPTKPSSTTSAQTQIPSFTFPSSSETAKPTSSSQALASQQQQQLQQQETREEVLSDLHIIDSSLQFINDLLRNMLDVQRAACHQLKIEKGPTDILRDILEPVDAMLYRRGRKCVEVIIDCPDPQLLVETDRLRLKQVVLNLGRNASKFVERGWIKFRVVVVPVHEQQSLGDGNMAKDPEQSEATTSVQIWIEDTGVGIPEEKKGQLFAKFQESLDSLSQGTGLGLSLCKILIHLMGGSIWLDETYHSGFVDRPGSRFVIDLNTPPMCVAGEGDGDELQSQTHPMQANGIKARKQDGVENSLTQMTRAECDGADEDKKMLELSTVSTSSRRRESLFVNPQALPQELSVLFVDDDTVLRKLLVRAVRSISPGWTIHEAASGEAALRHTDENTFDLIFMDQYMASMQKQLTGTETTQALRSKGVQSKICGLSANDMAVDFFAAGADAFVCKPLPTKKASLHQILSEILLGKVSEMEGAPNGIQSSSLVMTP